MPQSKSVVSPVKRPRRVIDGLLLLDKPQGMSSNQALQRVKHLLQAAKAGHTGSLDPLATGMLPICLGEATKFAGRGLEAHKTYEVEMRLGYVRTTLDAEGEIRPGNLLGPMQANDIETVLAAFRGEQYQTPPMYSALKQQGRPLYELARQGIEVERAPRRVCIDQLELRQRQEDHWILRVSCSKGTYIRSLVDDLGQRLGCGAYVVALRRLQVGCWTQMHSLNTVAEAVAQETLAALLLPVSALVQDCKKLELCEAIAYNFRQGQSVLLHESPEVLGDLGERAVFVNGAFIGMGTLSEQQRLSPLRLLAVH